jgi:hypothetical protein
MIIKYFYKKKQQEKKSGFIENKKNIVRYLADVEKPNYYYWFFN